MQSEKKATMARTARSADYASGTTGDDTWDDALAEAIPWPPYQDIWTSPEVAHL